MTRHAQAHIARGHRATLELPANHVPPFAGEKRIYRVPVFTAAFCQALLEELEHFEQSDMPKGRPNTMNNYGVGEAGTVGAGWPYLRCWRRAVGPC